MTTRFIITISGLKSSLMLLLAKIFVKNFTVFCAFVSDLSSDEALFNCHGGVIKGLPVDFHHWAYDIWIKWLCRFTGFSAKIV